MDFAENLKLFVPLPSLCGDSDNRSAISTLPPCVLFLNTQVIYLFWGFFVCLFSVKWAPVSRILAFLFNKKKIPNYLLPLAVSLYTEKWKYNISVKTHMILIGCGGGGIRCEMVQIFCAYCPHFSDNSSTLYFYWLPLFYWVVFIKCLERQEIS